MAHVINKTGAVSGKDMAIMGIPLYTGRAEFRAWVKEMLEDELIRVANYQKRVAQAQDGVLDLFGIFGGVEVYFFDNEHYSGVVLIDPATMEAWRAPDLCDADEVRTWADELGLQPRVGSR